MVHISTDSNRKRVAVVTGAGRGIGRAIALRLARDGVFVVANDINVELATHTHTLVCEAGGFGMPVVADISKERDVRRLFMAAGKVNGGIDILVNNAGVDSVGRIGAITPRTWSTVLQVDLGGPYLCSKFAERYFLHAGGGCIVNISSIHAFSTQPSRCAYASAKAGVIGLTKALCAELGPIGVRVNAILPGYIQTEIWDEWLGKAKRPARVIKAISAQHPLKRVGSPADIAGAVAFLVSNEAAFITGATLVIDGGLTATFPAPPV